MFCAHDWGRDGRGTMTCYRCGVTMPDPDYQLQMQWEMTRRAEREARQAAEYEDQLRALKKAKREAGVDRVRPLQLYGPPIPPGVATGRTQGGGATASLTLACSIDPDTLELTYPAWEWALGQFVWLPGRYVVVVRCEPVIPASRLEWFVRHRAVSFEKRPESIEAQRSQPFGEWTWFGGLDNPGHRVAWCPVQCDAPGDYEFGVINGHHGGKDSEPAWLARGGYTLWYPPGHDPGRRTGPRPAGTEALPAGVGAGLRPPPTPPGPSPPVAWAGGTGPSSRGQAPAAAPIGGIKPSWVALAIFLCFPLGFHLLKRHPALGRDKRWWGVGWAWAVLGGWAVAIYTVMFSICLLPILLPVGLYLKNKPHGSTIDTLLRRVNGLMTMVGGTGVGTKSKVEMPELAEGEGLDPKKVALAIYFCFPLGLYLLWNHPTLGRNKAWWRVGGAWSCLVFVLAIVMAANVEKDKKSATSLSAPGISTPYHGSTTQERRLMLVEAERLWDAGRHEEAQGKYSEFYRSWSSGIGILGGGEKLAFRPHLPKFYARFIQYCLDTYRSEPVRYSGELKLARQQLDYANKNGVPVPADLAERVRGTQKGADSSSAAKGRKYKAFKAVVAKLKRMPDRFAGMGERERFNGELSEVIAEFEAVPFDANLQADEGRRIVELYEFDVQGRYSGQLANEVDALVRGIYSGLINRR